MNRTSRVNNSELTLAEGRPVSQIVQPLLDWFSREARDLPWRRNRNPYTVWVSEIMLQQTRVAAVIPYYLRFLEAFPDIEALAQAPEERLLKLWEGLGYYSRARNMQKAARIVCSDFGGVFPDHPEKVRSLPGIGDYTAGAICSIAFGLPEPAVDGNVIRVLSRLSRIEKDPGDPNCRKEMETVLRDIYPKGRCGDFTESLMELGALVCLPNQAPSCTQCPLAELCSAHAFGEEMLFPRKTAKPEKRHEQLTVFLIRCGGAVALRRRPEKGLLSSMWELPNTPGHLDPEKAGAWLHENGIAVFRLTEMPARNHVFTHIVWEMKPYLVECAEQGGPFRYTDLAAVSREVSLPNAFRKLIPEDFFGIQTGG